MTVGCEGSLILALNKLALILNSSIVMAAQSSAWSRPITSFQLFKTYLFSLHLAMSSAVEPELHDLKLACICLQK